MKRPCIALTMAAVMVFLTANNLAAQDLKHCATDEVRRQMINENPALLHQEAQYEQGLQDYLLAKAGQRDGDDTTVYVLPVVFHILYDPTTGSDAHNITDAQVYGAMEVLNRDYAKLNTDISDVCCGYGPIAANVRVQFQLATKDPYGNCTNGIDRITSQRSTDGGNFSKLNPWPRNNYINIWVVRSLSSQGSFSPAGFSQLPPDVQDDYGALRDGVILLHDYTGDNGTSNLFRSRTLTHEVGHYLNLKHTWGSTNNPGVACGDDGVADTPMTKGHQSCSDQDKYDSFCSWEPVDTAYHFSDVTTTSGATDPTPVPEVAFRDSLPGLLLSSFQAVNLSANSNVDGSFAFSNWDLGAQPGDSVYSELSGQISTNKYYQFTVTPEARKSMTLSGLAFQVDRSGSGPRTFSVRSSLDNFGTNLQVSVPPMDTTLVVEAGNVLFFRNDTTGESHVVTVSTNENANLNLISPVTYRIYGWNAEDDLGYLKVDSVAPTGQFGIIENVQNYMEYAYCSRMFTHDQASRMRATLNSGVSGRNNLWQDANHAYTGTDGYETTCGPQADFYALDRFVCPGTSVQFKDNSTRATPTSWAWTFEGGNPATSDQQNPTVSFDEPGYHNVTLTVGNDFGANSITKNDAVLIGADYGQVEGTLTEPFNTLQDFQRWPTLNWENNLTYWRWNDQVGHDAPGCAMLNASETYHLVQDGFVPNNFADKDLLVTPVLDLRFATGMHFNFWYAYASQTGTADNITEELKVYSSSDCGKTWSLRKTISGGDLLTAGVASPGYVPSANEWRQESFTIPSIYANTHVRFMFEYSSGLFSNDIYIDDVNIDGNNVGIDELALSGGLGLMPNPATDHVAITMDLASSSTGTLSILDMTGRQVYAQAVNAGQPRLDLDLAKLNIGSGVYLVRLKHAAGQRVERLIVQ